MQTPRTRSAVATSAELGHCLSQSHPTARCSSRSADYHDGRADDPRRTVAALGAWTRRCRRAWTACPGRARSRLTGDAPPAGVRARRSSSTTGTPAGSSVTIGDAGLAHPDQLVAHHRTHAGPARRGDLEVVAQGARHSASCPAATRLYQGIRAPPARRRASAPPRRSSSSSWRPASPPPTGEQRLAAHPPGRRDAAAGAAVVAAVETGLGGRGRLPSSGGPRYGPGRRILAATLTFRAHASSSTTSSSPPAPGAGPRRGPVRAMRDHRRGAGPGPGRTAREPAGMACRPPPSAWRALPLAAGIGGLARRAAPPGRRQRDATTLDNLAALLHHSPRSLAS